MARKNIEHMSTLGGGGGNGGGASSGKKRRPSPAVKYFSEQPPPVAVAGTTQRLSPSSSFTPSPGSSTRSSPGLLAGHYAGCKWTEPPSPAALPPPPPQWTQLSCAFAKKCGDANDITSQLKLLLNMQVNA